MKLTPLDIRHKEFRRAMRGYSDEDVDLFLDEVADEFERLFQENIEARERLEQLEEKVRHHESLKETLQKTLVSAQQQADGTRANARKEAELILKDAEIKGRDLLSESYGEKQRVQQALTQLKQVEEDFRFKFRSLLEAHLNLLSEDEVSEERRRFRGLVAGIETDLQENREAGSSGASSAAQTPIAVPVERAAEVDAATAPVAPPSTPMPVAAAPAVLAPEPDLAPEPGDVSSPGPFAPLDISGGLLEFEDDPASPAPAYDDLELEDDRRGDRAQRKDSSVRRFLFGRKETRPDGEGDFFDDSEDRDFHW